MMDWDKLIADLKAANTAAKAAADATDDGGSANLDSVFLRIPKQRESKVLEAIAAAGLYGRCKSKWLGQGYFINPSVAGQGNKRCAAAEAMCRHLQNSGWDALSFYKAD